jgi:ribosomal protein S12 methylthiotransferase
LKKRTLKTKTLRKEKVKVVTLGCSKNLVDSENMVTQLRGNDFMVLPEESEEADVVIVNTCGFIDVAKEESINTILHYASEKGEGSIDKLLVTGCLSQRYREDLEREIPEVDGWFGTMELPGLLARLNADYQHELIGERWISTPAHYAYLKISEGCNRTCSFCAIPLMRGNHVSKPIDALVKEASHLARQGVRELMLIAQELTYYGLDLYRERALPRLLHALADVEGIEWIRLHYAYPSKFPVEVLEAMAARPEVCKYLDMPLQHASDSVLKRMRRQITRAETVELIQKAREILPELTLRTTMLVGFPGETESEFEELCDFVREMRFNRLGVFQYSHEENTRAYDLEDDVPAEVKARRAGDLMAIQQEISAEMNQGMVGKRVRVLFDRKEGDHFVGRTEGDSPEVDNEVLVSAAEQFVRIGDFAEVEVIQALEYDLIGRVVGL